MKRVATLWSIVFAMVLVFSGAIVGAKPAFADSDKVVINILHTNDTHGRMKGTSTVIGIDTVSKIKQSMSNAVLVDAGDTFHGLPFATMSKGEDIVNLMNLAKYDYMAAGNHDFNYGYNRLVELRNKAQFTVMAANVKLNENLLLDDNEIKTIDGVKVGFFGLTTPETAYKTSPSNVVGVTFESPVEIAKQQVASLKAQGAEIIIAIGHVGIDKSSEYTSERVANEVDGIDVFVDGHSHSLLPEGLKVKNTLITSAGEYLGNLGHVTLTYDKTTKELTKSAKLFTKVQADVFGKDDVVTKEIAQIDSKQSAILSTVIGKTDVLLDGARENVRRKETNLGNLLTDAMLAETKADIAITNGGGIRASINPGDITKGNIIGVLPFGNYIVTKKLTGKEIKAVLEHGVRAYPESLGGFPHVGGFTFTFDAEKPAGERVVNMKFNGKLMDLDKVYVVATNDFMAVGGDAYPIFGTKPTENEFSALDEVLASHISRLGTVTASVEGRITVGKGPDFSTQYVLDRINELPANMTLADKAKVEEARVAYDSLTKEQQSFVTNVDKLVKAETTIADIEAANKVVEKINALPTTITLADKGKVEEARVAYNALTNDQQVFVTNYSKLESAEKKIIELEKPISLQIKTTSGKLVGNNSVTNESIEVILLGDNVKSKSVMFNGKSMPWKSHFSGNGTYVVTVVDLMNRVTTITFTIDKRP